MSVLSRRTRRCSIAAAAWLASLDALGASIVVRGDNNVAVADAQVWVNCDLRGTTDSNGEFNTLLAAGDHIVARKVVSTSPSHKGQHDGDWAFRVWHTNVVQNNDGTWSDTVVTAPSNRQTIQISSRNAVIGFNLVASVEYNATAQNLDEIRQGFINASEFLADVTDGQMVLENVSLYDDNKYFANADVRFYESQWPCGSPAAKASVQEPWGHIELPGGMFKTPWNQPTAYRTLVHEFGHYGIGAYDEYLNDDHKSKCSLDQAAVPETHRASIMDRQYEATEFCGDANHNADTDQGRLNHKSVWGTLVDHWQDADVALKTPMTRGGTNPGPTSMPCMFRTQVRIEESTAEVCPGVWSQVVAGRWPIEGVDATLFHGDREYYLGSTNADGKVVAYGAAAGDRIDFRKTLSGGPTYYIYQTASVPVTGCGRIHVELRAEEGWIDFHWLAKFSILDKVAEIRIPVSGSQSDLHGIEVMVRTPGLTKRRVAVKFDAKTRSYVGKTPYDARYGPSLDVTVHAIGASGTQVARTSHFDGALYHPNGPGTGAGGETETTAQVAGTWNLFLPDAAIGLRVDSRSLTKNTSVSVGATKAPATLPSGWAFVGGPVSVMGDSPVLTKAQLQLRYDVSAVCAATEPCRADAETFRVLHYNGQDWDTLPTTADAEQQTVSADVTGWGVYAVAAPAKP